MRVLKGWFGEKKTTFFMWLSLDKDIYHRFHDIIIPSDSGTTQIDHLLITRYGIFIIETKNIKGWIFGSENQEKWTQVLFDYRYTFQNPLKQTYRQKKVLSKFFNINESLINTVIYFVGNSEFKTKMPFNVIDYGLTSYIKQFDNHIFSETEIERFIKIMKIHRQNSKLTKKDHLRSLEQRLSSQSICPKCGSNLIIRQVKNGINQGSQFWGCKEYPICKFTKNL